MSTPDLVLEVVLFSFTVFVLYLRKPFLRSKFLLKKFWAIYLVKKNEGSILCKLTILSSKPLT